MVSMTGVMTRHERTAVVALSGWFVAWFVIMAWNGGGSWHFFVQGAHALADSDDAIRGGLHTYAAAPILQIGPVALLAALTAMPAGTAGALLIWQVRGAVAGLVILWQVRRIGPMIRPDLVPGGRLDRRVAAAGVFFMPVWLFLAAWLPFFLADPGTNNALHFTITNTDLSALRVLGVHDARTPPWDRPAQAAVGVGVAVLAWRRGRGRRWCCWPSAPASCWIPAPTSTTSSARRSGTSLARARDGRGGPGTACLGLFTARWVPMPAAAHGWLTLAYVAASALLLTNAFSGPSGPECEAHTMTIARRMANKVPEVTVYFWIIKVLATTVGETAADLLNMNLGLGLTWTTVVVAILTAAALALQFRSGRYVPWRYWLAVILISVAGTLITDNLVDNLGVPLEVTTAVFAAALTATFALWYRSERTLSIHTITTTRREFYYWAAILFTFALGTAAGDLLAERINLGYLPSAGIFAAAIAVIAIAFRARVLGAVFAFWAAYVLTRPLGASLGDWLSQSRDDGGLGLGTVGPSVVFLLASVALVAHLTRSRVDAPAERPAAPAPINAHTYP